MLNQGSGLQDGEGIALVIGLFGSSPLNINSDIPKLHYSSIFSTNSFPA